MSLRIGTKEEEEEVENEPSIVPWQAWDAVIGWREEEEEMEHEEEEEEEERTRRRIVEDEFKDVVWETLDEDARANLYYYVVDNCLTAEDFSCYPLEEDEIQPPQSSDDEGCPHMLSSAAHHWLWSPATGWQRAREVDAESVAA